MPLTIPPAEPADYPVLAAIGRLAFQADKEKYGLGPAIYENPSFLLPLLQKGDSSVRKLVADGETIGVLITRPVEPGVMHLGCLCVLPSHHSMGYGSQALRMLEQACPAARRWELDTPAASVKNRRFYEKNGYRVVNDTHLDQGPDLVVLAKDCQPAAGL